MDTEHARRVVQTALANAEAAKFSITKRIEHAVRAVMQKFPDITADDAVKAVQRVSRSYR